jgi:hypothetical protein
MSSKTGLRSTQPREISSRGQPSQRDVAPNVANCQPNNFPHLVVAVFPKATLEKPRLRWDEHELRGAGPRFLAAFSDKRQPTRLLEIAGREYRLVELNRPFTAGASFRNSTSVVRSDGTPAIEPWSAVATGPEAQPAAVECRGFWVSPTSLRDLRWDVRPGSCASNRRKAQSR